MPIARVNGLNLSYTDSGQGTPFLLLPGTCENKEYWHEYQVPFFSKNYRVITVDQRGIGDSDRVTEPFETTDLAADAMALLDEIGATEPAHVLGHSMGGRTAQWMALNNPDRVRSLVLVSSGSGQYDDSKPVERNVPIWQTAKMLDMGFEAYARNNMTGRLGFTTGFRAAHPEIPEKLFNSWKVSNPTPLSYLLYSRARQRHETSDRLADLQCPVLALCGSDDTVMGGTSFHPESTRYLAEHTKKGTLKYLDGGAHHIFWEMPDATNAVIDEFLRRS